MFKNFVLMFVLLSLSIISFSQELIDEDTTVKTSSYDHPTFSLFFKAGYSLISLDNDFISYVLPNGSNRSSFSLSIEPERRLSNNLSASLDLSFSFMSNKSIVITHSTNGAEDGYMSLTLIAYLNYFLKNDINTFIISAGAGVAKSRYTYDGDFYTTSGDLISDVSDWSCNTMYGWSVRVCYLYDNIRAAITYSTFYTDLQDDSYIGFNHSLTINYLNFSVGINVL